MKKIELKSRKLLRTLFGCLSFTAIAFVFQACYGTEPDCYYDVKFTGTVRSKNTNLPIKGIKIAVNNEKINSGFTDNNGNFAFYASVPNEYCDYHFKHDSVKVYFLDIDGIENGSFEDKVIIINPAHNDEVKIHVELEEKL
jgi:putative lipoprotein (rSAM/lipoprotein system)